MIDRYAPRLAGTATLALMLVGCAPNGTLETQPYPRAETDSGADEDPNRDSGNEEVTPVEGAILVPERVEVYVGEELLLDVRLEDSTVGLLRPTRLPEGSEFEELEDGGLLYWTPEPEDVGTHDVVFLLVDIDDPNLVIFQRSTIIEVLPRLDLIEYGF
jgi:hypothetical protein